MGAAPPPSPSALLAALGRAHRLYFRDVDRPELFGQMLADILELTGCEYGFIGEVLYDDDRRYLKSWALTDIAWDEPTRQLYAESQQPDGGLVFANLNTLFGRVLTSQQPVIANDPAHDPRRGGLPPGHPPLHSFLGVPLMRGDDMVGMVGIANRQGGFDEHDAEFLAPYLELCAHLIDVIRTDRERSAAQTAEREAREAAQRQEHLSLIGRLASGVAHDMNNLITVVSMQCELMELDDHLSAEAQRSVARIRDMCDTASTMAARLNGLRTRSPSALVRCQPHEVMEQSQGVLAAIAGGELTLEFHLDAELQTGDQVAMTDSDLLQVLMNLVSNARDAADGVGHVVISTALEGETDRRRLRLEVSDNGPGIPSTLRGSAFDPFTSSKGPGHGLGLPTVRTLVEMAQGRIELIDDGEPGTTFVIVLPLVD